MSTHDDPSARDAPLGGHDEFEALAVGQAMHALEPDDEQRLAVHLMSCPSCARAVVDSAALGAAMAGTLAPVEPPPGLRIRLLDAVEREPRAARPRVRPAATGPTDAVRRPAGDEMAGVPAASAARWRRPRVLALTAVLAGILGAGVAVPATLSLTGSGGSQNQTALSQAITAPGSHSVALTGGGGATGRAVVTDKGLFLMVDGLPHNDAHSTTYVLWTTADGGQRKALATFDVSERSLVLVRPGVQPLPPGTGFAVSYEKGRSAPAQPSDVMLTSNA